jgi:hypothetical protein
VDHQAEAGEARASFEPAGDVTRQRDARARDAVDGLARRQDVRLDQADSVMRKSAWSLTSITRAVRREHADLVGQVQVDRGPPGRVSWARDAAARDLVEDRVSRRIMARA